VSSTSLIVVTPVYEDLETLRQLLLELTRIFGNNAFIVVVDDGSVESPVQPQHLEACSAKGVILRLNRNIGHQRAIAVGLGYVCENLLQGQRIVIMDADGEDSPAAIASLLERMDKEDQDIVVAKRGARSDAVWFKIFYFFYCHLFRILTGRRLGFGNFMALQPWAARRLVTMQETAIHLAGAVVASQMRIGAHQIDRGVRYAGKSKMKLVPLVVHGFKGLIVFAEEVLVRIGVACAIFAALSLFGAAAAISLDLLGYSVPSSLAILLGTSFLLLMQTGATALMTLFLAGLVRSSDAQPPNLHQRYLERVEQCPRVRAKAS
jgi:hypothetical protein